MPTDAELLRLYAEEKSEPAFGELVRRQVNLVYSIALRQCGGDAHLAEDVAQRVFTDLARKAGSLSGQAVLGGWLYRSAQFAASDVVRAERRRRAREQEAQVMQEISQPTASDEDWQKLAPVLDRAIGELAPRDRDAVVLRFFEGRPFAEIGTTLRLTEDAARMRVERALDKLRAALARHGITSTIAALGFALANQAAATAPAGFAAIVTGTALAGAAANSGVEALLAFLTMSKIKIGIAGAVIAAVLAMGLVELRANRELRAELAAARADRDDTARLQKENRELNTALQKLGARNPEADELARLQRRAAVLEARPPGVIEAKMKKAATWGNVGRATPEAANETLHWAMFHGDIDAVASLIIFDDDTPQNREVFMAHFSNAIRARYLTPERLYAATFFSAGLSNNYSPADALQVIDVDDHVGGNGSRFGQKRVRLWYALASGDEFEGGGRWQSTPDGWAVAAFSLSSWTYAVQALDPATGNRLAPTPSEHLPLKK